MYENGLFIGLKSDTFAPTSLVNRHQMWMVLDRISGRTLATMAESAAWAAENSILNGSNSKLLPASGASRSQIAVILSRHLGK